jgi:hypothetical protein
MACWQDASKNEYEYMKILQSIIIISFFLNSFVLIAMLILISFNKKLLNNYIVQIQKFKTIKNKKTVIDYFLLLADPFIGFYFFITLPKENYFQSEILELILLLKKMNKILLISFSIFVLLLILLLVFVPNGAKI